LVIVPCVRIGFLSQGRTLNVMIVGGCNFEVYIEYVWNYSSEVKLKEIGGNTEYMGGGGGGLLHHYLIHIIPKCNKAFWLHHLA
jgi:hypothetical protein